MQPETKLAAVPTGVPMGQTWHTTREGAMDRVCEILGREGGPRLAALAGRNGSGKTTAAAAMVGERGPIRPRVYLMRALEIKEAKLGPDDVQVAEALMKLAGSLRGMGRRQSAASEP